MFKVLITLILIVYGSAINLDGQSEKNGLLKGVITDQMGSLVVGATIYVENLEGRIVDQFRSNAVGEYETRIPPGIYVVKVKKTGFCSQRRAPLEVSDQDATANVSLLVCSIKSVLRLDTNLSSATMEDQYDIPYKEDLIPVNGQNSFRTAQIQYGDKSTRSNRSLYGPIHLSDNSVVPARLTYNRIQLAASSIESIGNGFFVANNGVFEDGSNSFKFDRLVLLIGGGSYDLVCRDSRN
jgi:hypothetical protein